MTYVLRKRNRYYFNRRVPLIYSGHDPRKHVRFALDTDSHKDAQRLALIQNDNIEKYWQELVRSGGRYKEELFESFLLNMKLAIHQSQLPATENRHYYFAPFPAPLKAENNPRGAVLLDKSLELYWEFAKDKLISKTPNQIRKWQTPRRRAMRNLIACIGNKGICDVSREDILKFRDWWIGRIQNENLVENSANKDFIHLKLIFETASDNLKLNIDIKHLFGKLLLTEDGESEKRPFSTNFIVTTLLNETNLSGLNEQARCVLMAMAETGAGITELTSLAPEDIILDSEIPHIAIAPKQKGKLKTRYRKRTIPLVGYALDAFKMCPGGFPSYNDRPDGLSAVLNKYLRERNMLPSSNHTVNSLRHSFQDRLLASNAPDRVQADLMGHKFDRPKYGEGSTLKQKYEWLFKIRLKAEIELK